MSGSEVEAGLFSDYTSSVITKKSSKYQDFGEYTLKVTFSKETWGYNDYTGNVIKSKSSSKKKHKEVTEDVVIDIPRDSVLQVAINNKGKYFLEKNKELAYAINHPYYLKSNVLTKAECKLFEIMLSEINKRLACINKSIYIFPKVRIADFIEVQDALKFNREYFYKIAQKHIDYLIFDSSTFNLICAVELDDSYHYRADKIERDNFVNETLRGCGLTLFRVDEPIKNVTGLTISNIVDYILDYYTPVCKKCGAPMISRKSKRNSNYGHRFYGCTNWKSNGSGCDYTLDID